MTREDIIREVARTLFVCAWADGVEAGEIAGEGPGPGGDWMDAAPSEGDPAADAEARRIVDAFDAAAVRVPRYVVELPASAREADRFRTLSIPCPTLAEAQAQYTAAVAQFAIGGADEMPPIGAPDAILARAERGPDGRIRGWILLRDRSTWGVSGQVETDRESPVETAARLHAYLSGTDRFAHCLAMTALGHGVGLEDDLRSGDRLPGWIRASVPASGFGWVELDPERYPPPDSDDAEGGAA